MGESYLVQYGVLAVARSLTRRVDRLEEAVQALVENSEKDRKEWQKFRQQMADFLQQMEKDRKEFYRQLGDLSRRFGRFAEDFVIPNASYLLETYFQCPLTYFTERSRRFHRHDSSKQKEFDIVAACDHLAFVFEIKTTPRDEYLTAFVNFVKSGEFFDYFPELEGRTLIPIFATFHLEESQIRYLSHEGILVMVVKEGLMDFINFDDVASRFQ